jgi:hypothetical protein
VDRVIVPGMVWLPGDTCEDSRFIAATGIEYAMSSRAVGRPGPASVDIVIVDTHNADDDHVYLQELYNSYRDFSPHATLVNLRVLLILLNKADLWGSTTASREAMMHRYRTEVIPEIVNRFRSGFGVTVQFGYASLTQPEHTPYNNLILKEFLTALHQRSWT